MRKTTLTLSVVIWAVGVTIAVSVLLKYDTTAGRAAVGPASPSSVMRSFVVKGKPVVIMFAHPKCPCTRASIAELTEIAAEHPGRESVRVLFYAPDRAEPRWAATGLWHDARAIAGADVQLDRGGAIARSCGISTSGQVVAFDAEGKVVFRGGITGSRGVAGENAGARALRAALLAGKHAIDEFPVFGCSLVRE